MKPTHHSEQECVVSKCCLCPIARREVEVHVPLYEQSFKVQIANLHVINWWHLHIMICMNCNLRPIWSIFEAHSLYSSVFNWPCKDWIVQNYEPSKVGEPVKKCELAEPGRYWAHHVYSAIRTLYTIRPIEYKYNIIILSYCQRETSVIHVYMKDWISCNDSPAVSWDVLCTAAIQQW